MSAGLFSLLLAAVVSASSSEVIPVSGRLTTAEGRPVLAAYDVKFELLDDATAQDALWTETQNIAFEGGFFTVYLGSVTPLPPALLRDHRDLHLRITVDGDVMDPFPLGTVPYAVTARLADDARTLEGQTRQELIDSFPDVAQSGDFRDLTNVPAGLADGDDDLLATVACAQGQIPRRSGDTFVCTADLDTLGGLTCQNGELAKWNGFVWGCGLDRVLTEAEVDAFVGNNGYAATTNLAKVATTGAFADLAGIPAGLSDGDDDLLASLPCATGQIPRRSGDGFSCSADLDTLGGLVCQSGQLAKWNGAVWGCSADLDTLRGLTCQNGQLAKWNGTAWSCAPDRVLTEPEVDAYTGNNGYALSAALARVATTGAFADLGGIPAGLSDGDDDLLATVPCAPGSLLAYSAGGYGCTPSYAAAAPLVLTGQSFGLATGGVTDVHVSATASIAPAKIAGTAATLTGPQAFDGTTLVIDAANDRVGIGNAAPDVKLAVAGTVRATALEVIPRAQVRFVAPAEFVEINGSAPMRATADGLIAPPEPAAGSTSVGLAQAMLRLQPGEEVRRVSCLLFDNQVRWNASLKLETYRRLTRKPIPMPPLLAQATVVAPDFGTAVSTAEVTFGPGAVVFGAEEVLLLNVTYTRSDYGGGTTNNQFGFGGCEVEVFTSAP